MERPLPAGADGPAPSTVRGRLLVPALGLALVAWQAWWTLGLFGPGPPWGRLLDDAPVTSGRHPLHLYHGYLGARAFVEHGTLCCYDPNFQAGYPKTPVFDGGSRPAELFLSLAGGDWRPAAYKVGLAVCCVLAPLFLLLAARGAGLGGWAACLTAALGQLVWWGVPGRAALDNGDLDLLLGSLAAVAQAGLLLGFHRAPGVLGWLALLGCGCLGWLAYPPLFVLLVPAVLIYYLSVGARHGLLWHLALFAGLAGGVLVNGFWLTDWVSYWWIRAPLHLGAPVLSHRTFHTLWGAPLWGAPADRALAVALLAAAVVGAGVFNQQQQRATARLLGLGMLGLLGLAVAALLWEPLARLSAGQLLVPALLFATPLAAYAVQQGFHLLGHWAGGPLRGAALGGALVASSVAAGHQHVRSFAARASEPAPLAVGLSDEQEALVGLLRERTTPEARVLWEDRSEPGAGPHWTALLPLLTGRSFVGGLDPDAAIEHAYASFREQALAGRPVGEWSDDDLERFCRRYNVGWVVCWSPAAVARFRAWTGATATAPVQDGAAGYLFALRRTPSFALKGQARWLVADCERVALGDVVPENGEVLLSLHYQRGLQASPSRVQVEHEVDPYDPIPFVRLRLPGPVARLTLTWEKR
jgi:hypothetical protein